jgi:hypothetical protein
MNDYFCVMPFFGAEVNFKSSVITPCCLLENNANIHEIRNKMLQQQRPSECSACWKLEDQNIKSDRQYKNEAFDFYLNKDINFIEEDCKKGIYSKQIIKIYTSNLCNSTCITCSPELSSAWASLKKIKVKKAKLPDNRLNAILNYQTIKMLSFVGGEPLYEQKNFEILEQLINSGNTGCFISIVTNGSVRLTNYQIDILKNFTNLNICLSIDGINSKFEYLRYPLEWKILLENIEIFKSITDNLSVSYTISNLNLIYYDETVNWFNKQNLLYNHNVVDNPSYFSINSLPEHIKLSLSTRAKSLLRNHLPIDDLRFSSMINEIKLQDKLKKISIKDYMPEMYKIIQDNS